MLITLEDYQKDALHFLLENKHGALFIDPGLGKTAIVLGALRQLTLLNKIKLSLIIAPIRPVYTTWPDEIMLWDQFNHLTHQILHGKERFLNLQNKANIHLVNPENFQWVLDWCALQKKWPYDTLIVDESTKFKSTKSKRFKALKKVVDKFDRRYIMTGTPTPNSYLELFSQMYIVDKDVLGKYVTHFKAKYFFQTGYLNREWKIKPLMEEKIQKKIAPHVFTLQGGHGLPDVIVNDIEIKFDEKLQKRYKKLEKELFFALDENEDMFAKSAAHAYGMCRQFTSGQIYGEDGEIKHVHDLKIEATKDLISELQGKSLLLSYYYKHELARLKKLLKKRAVYAEIVKDFRSIKEKWDKGDIRIMVAQNQSLAHGLNLQHGGHNTLWFSLTDSLEDYIQFNDRLIRKGQKHPVVIHRLIVKDTVDVVQKYRLTRKGKSQTSLLEALQEYRTKKIIS